MAIAAGQIAIYARLLRSDMVATLQEDFILMAKSKGIPTRRVLWRHALRPSSLRDYLDPARFAALRPAAAMKALDRNLFGWVSKRPRFRRQRRKK